MFPFSVNNTFEYPFSGEVAQTISPAFFAAQQGVPEIERAIVQDVASYGDQLGALTKAVLALAESLETDDEPLDGLEDLREIAAKVARKKEEVRVGLRERAEMILRRLEEADPEAYAEVMGR